MTEYQKKISEFKKKRKSVCVFCGADYEYETNVFNFIRFEKTLIDCECPGCEDNRISPFCYKDEKQNELAGKLCSRCCDDYNKLSDIEEEKWSEWKEDRENKKNSKKDKR